MIPSNTALSNGDVLKVVKETGYHPNYMARGLRAAKTNSVGIIIDDLTEFSSTGIIDGIMSYFEGHREVTNEGDHICQGLVKKSGLGGSRRETLSKVHTCFNMGSATSWVSLVA